MVSILIPIYSVEKQIERCARSVFEQTYNNIEYIFVNDCSPDKSMEILIKVISEYPEKQKNIKIINNSTNKGISAVRNIAIENANGEFIMFVDSDDYIEKDAVEKLVTKQKETQADVVSGQAIQHTHNSSFKINREYYYDKKSFIINLINKKTNVTLWGRIIKKSLYTQHNIRSIEGINIGEDWLVMPQIIFFSNRASVISDIIYHYDNNNETSYFNTWHTNLDTIIHKWEQDKATMTFLNNFFYIHDKSFLYATKLQLKILIIRLMTKYCQKNDEVMYHSLKKELKHLKIELSLLDKIVTCNYYICKILGLLKTKIINPLTNKKYHGR